MKRSKTSSKIYNILGNDIHHIFYNSNKLNEHIQDSLYKHFTNIPLDEVYSVLYFKLR